jgi:hypothetical protein
MNRPSIITILLLLSAGGLFGQANDSLFSRLQAISNNGIAFFNVDGIEITSQSVDAAFSKKNILKKFKKYPIKEAELNGTDSLLPGQHYCLLKQTELAPGTTEHSTYYFMANSSGGITAISFASINKVNRPFERAFVQLVLNGSIPPSVYSPMVLDTINFAGRKIALGKSCNWMGTNNVQCPYYGQVNWSVHKTLEDASLSMANQYSIIKAKKNGKMLTEEKVKVAFEGTETEATKTVYDFKGLTSLLVGMSGGKTLTIYFVACPVRQHFVSCVMSFWNNDAINPSGLPPLLEKLMALKK